MLYIAVIISIKGVHLMLISIAEEFDCGVMSDPCGSAKDLPPHWPALYAFKMCISNSCN